ncbi:LamG-like jellyroll fold domain-containing protein [Pseudomonas fulva]|uniref:LamG-like jellyroll fold domain-containing protein n=1 Tax=Pseudomonas fulva TaxID=47880 RepID=UPI003D2F0DEF
MKTLVLKSRFALSSPLPGTPVLPTYDPSLMASYDASSMDVSGTTLTKWRNKQGAWGSAGDLVTAKSQFPITVDNGAAVFQGGVSETYMNSSVLAAAMPVGKATFLARVRFGTGADGVGCTIFSSMDTNKFVFLRRNATTRNFTGGVSGTEQYVDATQTVAEGVWADIALVADEGKCRIYVNDSYTDGSTFAAGSMPSLRLGANAAGVNRLIGRISHFQVYSRAIGADEMKEIRASL